MVNLIRVFFIIMGMLMVAKLALAHGQHFTDDENDWLNKQYASDGTKCCDRHDTVVGPDVEWRIQGGQYQVLIDNRWHPVPAELIMRRTADNPWPGQAIVTYSVFPSGPRIWCLWPGFVM